MSNHNDEACREIVDRLTTRSAEQPVWTRSHLVAFGVPDAVQSALWRRGLLVRLRHGVYAVGSVVDAASPGDRHLIDVAAAAAAAREPVWAFGASAALLHGLPLPFEAPEAVQVLRRGRQDIRALCRASKHRLTVPDTLVTSVQVRDDDLHDQCIRGIPVISRSAAAITAGLDLPHRWRVGLLDAVLWDGQVTQEDLRRTLDRWRHLGRVAEMTRAVDCARRGAQTVLETHSRLALLACGLPEPVLQHRFDDSQGLVGYVDFWWPGLRVVGEADGLLKYGEGADVVREKAREDRLRGLGVMVVRWTWSEIREDPAGVAARIRHAAALVA